MNLTLSEREQVALRRLLLATPDPGCTALPRSALEALARLVPCDALGVRRGSQAEATVRPTEPPGTGDTVRLQLDGALSHLFLVRHHRPFTLRERALLSMIAPALERLAEVPPGPMPEVLSDAELRVLDLVASGCTNRATARRLSVSEATVRKHLEHTYRKLGVSNRTAAVAVLRNTAERATADAKVSRFG